MAVRMVRLKRASSGRWAARKAIPEDVRAAFGQWEAKCTWDARLSEGQAKAAMAKWLAEIESRIAALRLVAAPPEDVLAIDLSARDCRALAGVWYADLKAQYEANPGDWRGWEASAEKVIPDETAETYGMTPEEAQALPLRVPDWLRRDAAELVAGRGMKLTSDAMARLEQDMAELYVEFVALMKRRAHNDWSPDPVETRLPAWQAPSSGADTAQATGPTIKEIFDAYARERRPREATVRQWSRNLDALVAFLGHEDASRVTQDDIVRWKDHLLASPSGRPDGKPGSLKTVKESYLGSMRAVFQAAVDNRRLAANPFTGVKVRGPKSVRTRDPGLSDAEAAMILSAALSVSFSSPPRPVELARRWVPWLCAYSGARVNEITQLRRCDVVEREGVWAIHITPEAGSTKTEEARWVPLHSHLIEQGFLAFVAASREGPLFYEPRTTGKPGQPPAYRRTGERLAEWVREIGVTDREVRPNHGWRHRFKTVARAAKVDAEAREVIAGHKPNTVGGTYGIWTLQSLAEEVEKLPRYDGLGAAAGRQPDLSSGLRAGQAEAEAGRWAA